jgi:hypothetical protein
MAVAVLVLWLFTAGAGFYLLVTSNLRRGHPAAAGPSAPPAPKPSPEPAPAPAARAASLSPGASSGPDALSPRDLRRAARDRWDPPSLVAARQAPLLPDLRSLLEFAHPACGIIGLAFWLGFALVHNQVLGWIGFGLVAVTASLGLAWFTANLRAARHAARHAPPRFAGRLLALHGGAAAVTVTLAALAALVLRG